MNYHLPSNNLSGAENEQGSSLTDVECAWLAGLMDGEACLGVYRARRSPQKHRIRYSARVTISTTSPELKDHLMATLKRLEGVKPLAIKRNVREMGNYKCSEAWNIVTGSNKQTHVLLKAVLPYLIEKRVQAELTLEYIEWRLTQPSHSNGGRGSTKQVDGVAEEAERIMDLLKENRHRNRVSRDNPSEITRLAPAA